jgi:anti-sigma regulatory factor (Ser/Thr protein kinase)
LPLSSQLTLDVSSRSAADARQWVSDVCERLDRDDLVECAALGVSELVSNAVLHGEAPIIVRVRGTASHPRIEVHDGSTSAPVPPEPARHLGELDDLDALLVTFGRGLSIVARCADAYGATIELDHKIVWFEPSRQMHEDIDVNWVIDRSSRPGTEPIGEGAVEIILRDLDLDIYDSLARQYGELKRELRLLSLGHQDDYPLAANLTAMFDSFERQFPGTYHVAVRDAVRRGQRVADIPVQMLPESKDILVTMAEMFDLADAFCRAERLLTIERTPLQREFHLWILGEVIAQLDGREPKPWRDRNRNDNGNGAGRHASSQVG